MSKVLVLAVHPDDETLGCGGTLLKHKKSGDSIHWLISTSAKESQGFAKQDIIKREKEIECVGKMFGFTTVTRLGISAAGADELPTSVLVKKISKVFNDIKPEVIYLPFMKDVHSDHRVIFEAAYSCIKTFRYPFIKTVLMMETISETELALNMDKETFVPNYFVDISRFMDKKIRIMNIFKNEIGKHPFPRSVKNIKALATFRGAMAGCKYAESFMLLKKIC
ncbi:MAG: PIG-L family deacetylase [Candidatus Omnitrophica bacterium]|nr:PIG-L family deacetylase [Candidatus Omnitrophota bacterium]